ncbi:MAG: hypothetical protein RL538_389 [Candidatus Parcubacteria bacterium]|jgi:hypothetical protein
MLNTYRHYIVLIQEFEMEIVIGFICGILLFSNLIDFNFLDYVKSFDTTLAALIAGWIAVKKFRFQSLHQKRLEIIEEVYERLVSTHDAFLAVMNPISFGDNSDSAKNQRKIELVQKANDFSTYYRQKKIFFDETMASELDAIRVQYQNILVNWDYLVDFPNTPLHEKHREWQKIWKMLNGNEGEVSSMKTKLEKKFRDILNIR